MSNISRDVAILVERYGSQNLIEELQKSDSGKNILSIISSEGMHRQPLELMSGEKYIFSEGMIDSTTNQSVSYHLAECCENLANKLREKKWDEIQLFFSGHGLLAAYAKMTVYRVTHLSTVDYGFFADSGYRCVDIDLRPLILTK